MVTRLPLAHQLHKKEGAGLIQIKPAPGYFLLLGCLTGPASAWMQLACYFSNACKAWRDSLRSPMLAATHSGL